MRDHVRRGSLVALPSPDHRRLPYGRRRASDAHSREIACRFGEPDTRCRRSRRWDGSLPRSRPAAGMRRSQASAAPFADHAKFAQWQQLTMQTGQQSASPQPRDFCFESKGDSPTRPGGVRLTLNTGRPATDRPVGAIFRLMHRTK